MLGYVGPIQDLDGGQNVILTLVELWFPYWSTLWHLVWSKLGDRYVGQVGIYMLVDLGISTSVTINISIVVDFGFLLLSIVQPLWWLAFGFRRWSNLGYLCWSTWDLYIGQIWDIHVSRSLDLYLFIILGCLRWSIWDFDVGQIWDPDVGRLGIYNLIKFVIYTSVVLGSIIWSCLAVLLLDTLNNVFLVGLSQQ